MREGFTYASQAPYQETKHAAECGHQADERSR
jgi:hypothetical protein